MNTKLKSLLLAGAAALGLATAALAGGMVTNQYPAATLPLTGNETIPADTNLSQGLNPQSEAITIPQIKTYERPAQTLTDAASIVSDWNVSALYNITLTASGHTIKAPSNLIQGASVRFVVTQDSTGSRTVTWDTPFQWAGGTAPTLTTTAAHYDVITCYAITATALSCSASLNVHH